MNEVLLFCRVNNIGIRKFLSTNYEVKYEKKEGKWKIKHEDIASLPNIVKVPLRFSERYKDLVYSGDIIIVCDDFGRYESYINPSLIKDLIFESSIKNNIANLKENKDKDSKLQKVYLEKNLAKIERTKRIMTFFTQTVDNKKNKRR